MAVTNEIQAAIQDFVIPKVHDIAYKDEDLVTLYALNKNCRKEVSAGEYVKAPIVETAVTGDVTQIINGNELIPTDKQDELDEVKYDWHFDVKPVVGYNREIEINCGNAPNRVFDYWATKTKIAGKAQRTWVASQIWTNTTDSAGYIRGLCIALRDYTNGSITTYGGLSVTDEGVLDPYEDASTTTLTIGAMEDAWMEVLGKTDWIVTGATLYGKYWALLQPQQRFADVDTARAGYKNVMFNTAPVTFDSTLTTSTTMKMAFLAWGSEEFKYINYIVHPQMDFAYIPVAETLPTQEVRLGRFRHAMQILVPGRRYQACFTALTG